MRQQKLSPFAKAKFDSLKASRPDLPDEEAEQIAREAAKQAEDQFGKAIEQGQDPWAVREQILADLTAEQPKPKPTQGRRRKT